MHVKLCLALLFALGPSALGIKAVFDAARLLDRHVDFFDCMLYRRAEELAIAHIFARMPQSPPAATTQSAGANLGDMYPANLDQAQVDAAISTACTTTLSSIKNATNEAGLLGCYNIPFLKTETGAFGANLRLYQISQPSGAFEGVNLTDISVQLSYPNAAFSTIPQDAMRQAGLSSPPNTALMNELESFLFLGQVSNTLSLTKLQDTELMALLIPSMQLSAEGQGGTKVAANLTSASVVFFVSGMFQGQGYSGAAAAAPTAAAAAVAKASAFILPGTSLGKFPVGLVITSIWALLFFAAVGFGTWERMQFRDQYRRLKQRAVAAGKD